MTTTTLANGTVLDNGTITAGNIDLIADNTAVYLQGTLDNAGTLELGSAGDTTILYIDSPTVSLTGGGVVLLSNNPDNQIYGVNTTDDVLVNVNNTIMGAGDLGVNNSNIPLSFTNGTAGIVDANDTTALILQPGGVPVVNNGLMEATGTGGLVITNGAAVTQASTGKLLASGGGNNVYLQNGADITGGTLSTTLGGLIEINSGTVQFGNGATTGLSISKNSTVQVNDNTQLNLSGTIDNLGTLLVDSGGDSTNLVIASPTVSLIGAGVLLLSENPNNRIYGAGGGDDVLVNVNNTIEGAGQIGANNGNVPLALTNGSAGIIDANGTVALVIQTGGPALVNKGLIEATGTGGLVVYSTEIDDTQGGTLTAIGTGNNVYLEGNADIAGGVLKTGGGGLIEIVAGNNVTFDGTTNAVTITAGSVVQIEDNAQLNLAGNVNILGTLEINSGGDSTNLVLQSATVSLTGGGVLLMSDNVNNRIYGSGTGNSALINVNDIIEGAGQIGVNNGNLPLALTNSTAGIIDANGTVDLVIQTGGPSLLNEGLIEATGTGGLVIYNTTIDDTHGGVIAAVGTLDNVLLDGAVDIAGGTLEATGGALIEVTGGTDTIDGSSSTVTITAGSTVQVEDNQQLNLLGNIDLAGTLAMGSTGDTTNIILSGTLNTLFGGGTLLMSDNINNRIYGAGSADDTLVNVNDTIAGAGQIGANNGNIPLALTNEAAGVIDSTGTAGMDIYTGGPVLLNAGLIEDTGTGGLDIYNTTIDQTTGTLLASGTGDNIYLQQSADIIGGVLKGRGGGGFQVNYGNATLDGSTAVITIALATDVSLDDNQQLFLLGTIDNLGTLSVDSTGDGTNLFIASPTVVLTGGGLLQMSDNIQNRIYGENGSNDTLINVNNTIEGSGQLGVNNGNVPLALINDAGGLIDATGTAAALYIQSGGPAVQNAGLIEDTGTAGLVIYDTTIDQTTGTLLASGAGHDIYLQQNADIVGGVLAGTGGGMFIANSGNAYLDGSTAALTIAANTTVELTDNQQMFLLGDIVNGGTLEVGSTGDGTVLYIDNPAVTLTGGGVLLLSNNPNNQIHGVNGSNDTLINVNNTIEGAGDLGVNNGNIPLALTNQTAGVIDANDSNALYIQTGGPSVSNAGLMEATSGGTLIFLGNGVTNAATGTIAAFDGSLVQFENNSDLLNESAGTLTGGSYIASAVSLGATLNIAGGGPLLVDAANIILSGTGSEIGFYNSGPGTYTAIESSLTEVSGTLQIDNARSYATANALTIDAGGHLDLGGGTIAPAALASAGTVFGYGEVVGTLTNTGKIEADGGTLFVSGNVLGAGSIVIDTGAVFDLGGTSSETIIFNPGTLHSGVFTGDDLILAQPSLYTGTLSGLAPGDLIDLQGLAAKSATISGSKLIVSLTAGGTIAYALASPNALDRLVTSSDGHGGTDITVFAKATDTTVSPTPVNFGEAHAGSVLVETYTIGNTGSFGQYSENLDATMGAHTGSVTDSGSFSGLKPGTSNSASLKTTLATGTAGVVSGTATVNIASDGTSVPGDGLGTLALNPQTVSLTGTIFSYATASNPGSVSLGQGHAGAALSQSISLANLAAGGGYSENLDASFSGTSSDLSASGSIGELAAGATNSTALALTLTGGTVGVNSGTATLKLTSDGSTIDTLGTTALGTETVTATETLFAYATASSAAPVSFGEGHVGSSLTHGVTLANLAAPGAYSENLDARFSGTSSDLIGGGALSELAAGSTNSSALQLTLSGTAGVNTGTAAISLVSDGSTIDTLGTTGLGTETVAASGTLFNYATASTATPVSFGIVHVGQSISKNITLSNTAAPGAYSENLDGKFSGTTGSFTTAGAISELAAGKTSSTNLKVTLGTGAAGTITGATTIALVSDGKTIDTLGTTALASETITLSGTVNNYATASVEAVSGNATLSGSGTSYLVNFGTVTQGAAGEKENLGILNSAAGPADVLSGSFTSSGTTGFTDTGLTAFSSVAAGAADTKPVVTLNTGTLGTFTETIVLKATGSNASGYKGALAAETITVTGTVVAAAAASPAVAPASADIAAIPAAAPAPQFISAPPATVSAVEAPLTGREAAGQIGALRNGEAWGREAAAHLFGTQAVKLILDAAVPHEAAARGIWLGLPATSVEIARPHPLTIPNEGHGRP